MYIAKLFPPNIMSANSVCLSFRQTTYTLLHTRYIICYIQDIYLLYTTCILRYIQDIYFVIYNIYTLLYTKYILFFIYNMYILLYTRYILCYIQDIYFVICKIYILIYTTYVNNLECFQNHLLRFGNWSGKTLLNMCEHALSRMATQSTVRCLLAE